MGHREPEYDADNPILRSSQPIAESANLTDAFTREACEFIERNHQQPWFLCLAFNAVHSPMQGSDKYMARFARIGDVQRRIFAAMLAHLDESVGQVIARLHHENLEERTLIFFVSDNGGPTKELTSSNAPLRGGKGELWEGGIRVPYIISWKGVIPEGRAIDQPVTTMDASATALHVANARRDNSKLDGVSLWPILAAQSRESLHSPLYWRVGKKHALRSGQWKIVRDAARWNLYNLDDDIAETKDLASQQPARVAELSAVWDRWNAEQAKPRW